MFDDSEPSPRNIPDLEQVADTGPLQNTDQPSCTCWFCSRSCFEESVTEQLDPYAK